MTKQQVVQKLRKYIGTRSLREAGEAMGVTAAYLSDVLNGRRDPGPSILAVLNLEKIESPASYREKSA